MIIEGGSRRAAGWWSHHVQDAEKNEQIELVDVNGLKATTIAELFREMQALARGAPDVKNFFYQHNIDPRKDERLTDPQWQESHAMLRENLGLEGQPGFCVRHTKRDPETGAISIHEHGFTLRIDLETMTAIPDSLTARIHEQTSRQIEEKFDLARGKSVLVPNREEPRPERGPKKWEQFRGEESGLDPAAIGKELQSIKERSDNGQSFKAGIEAAGYVLTQGDRRDFLVIDHAGDEHSLGRRLGIKAAELREFMKDVDRESLPTVAEGKIQQHARAAEMEQRRAADRYDELQPERAAARAAEELKPERGMEGQGIHNTPSQAPENGRAAEAAAKTAEHFDRDAANAKWGEAIEAAAIQAAQEAERAERRAEWQAQKEAERAQARINEPVTGDRAEIRAAWRQSRDGEPARSGGARLDEALAARGFVIARATADEAYQSERTAAFAKEAGNYAPVFKESEIVAINSFGRVYHFDERSTGQLRDQIEQRLAGIDTLPSITEAKIEQRVINRAEWIEERRAEDEKARPATAIEQRIIDCRQTAREDGAQIIDRKGELKTIYGPEAFAARLDEAGLTIVRITETDARALDELRGGENLARDAAWTNGESYRTHHFAEGLEAGDIACVTRQGDVYKLNPHRLDLDGIASVLESAARDGRLPSMSEARIAFLIERNADAALREERKAEFFGRHMEGMEIAAGYTELRADVRNAERAVSQNFDHAADQLGNIASAAGALLGEVAKGLEKTVDFLGDMLAPEPSMTRDQAERTHAAHEEFRRDLAAWAAEEAAKAERDQARREIREAADKQRNYDKLTGRSDEDRQAEEEDRERDRGRERSRF